MKKGTFKSYEDLPLMLSVPEMGAALGISRAGAYELARSEGEYISTHFDWQKHISGMGRQTDRKDMI